MFEMVPASDCIVSLYIADSINTASGELLDDDNSRCLRHTNKPIVTDSCIAPDFRTIFAQIGVLANHLQRKAQAMVMYMKDRKRNSQHG